MNGDNGNNGLEVGFQRILVALNASRESRALLDFTADLAAQLGVTLTGVFIEDTDIAEYADLPIAREISLSGGTVRALSRKRMESHFRAEAAAVERLLVDISKTRRVECSFELRHGRFEAELAALATESDLLALSPASGYVVRSRRQDVFARFKESAASGFIAYGGRIRPAIDGQRIVAVYTGSKLSLNVMALAARLSANSNVPLTVVLAGDVNVEEAKQMLGPLYGVDRVQEIMKPERSTAVFIQTRMRSPRLVIIPSDLPETEQFAIRDTGVPVIVLRGTLPRADNPR